MKKIFESETKRPLMCSIALWPSTKCIQIIPLGLNRPPPPPHTNKKLTFSEYGHAAYQIKGNVAYNNILTNIMLLHLPLTRGVGTKVNLFSFLKVVMLRNQISWNEANIIMHANVLPFYTPLAPVWGQKVKKNLKKVMVHITLCN